MPTIAIVLCKYVLAIALVRINFVYLYDLSLCKLVAKVNYYMFQSQTFRMWRRHAAATKIMMVEATYAFVKLKQIKAAVSAGGIKFGGELACHH